MPFEFNNSKPHSSSPDSEHLVAVDYQTKPCSNSPLYRNIVDKFFHVGYDIPTAEQRRQMKGRSDCLVGSNEEARKKANESIEGVTKDPYNYTYSKEEYKQHKESLKSSFGGLGLGIDLTVVDSDGRPVHPTNVEEAKRMEADDSLPRSVVVSEVRKDTPAAKAGFQTDDVISNINGVDELHRNEDAVVSDIRGPLGTSIRVTVLRNGEPVELKATRAEIKTTSVDDPEYRGKDNDIAYIKIKNFHVDASTQFEAAMRKMPDAKAYVLDFRDDGGGEVDEALKLPQNLVERGSLMFKTKREESSPDKPIYSSTQYRLTADRFFTVEGRVSNPTMQPANLTTTGSERKSYLANGKPIVMITNGGTASAAELAIAAVHDNSLSETVGEPSHGKGIIQCNWPVTGGWTMKTTCGRYLTPTKHWMGDSERHRYPLQPDKRVKTPDLIAYGVKPYGSSADDQLNVAIAEAERLKLGGAPIRSNAN